MCEVGSFKKILFMVILYIVMTVFITDAFYQSFCVDLKSEEKKRRSCKVEI